jgi:hypothetical protein
MSVVNNKLRINAVTRADRNEVIERVRQAMIDSGAWVLDVKQFSNVSMCFQFEIPIAQTNKFREALIEAELQLAEESNAFFSSARSHSESDESDIAGTLQITFIHNEPDLRIKVPAIPG